MKNTITKIHSLVQLYQLITEEERIITDVLRQIILDTLPGCKEKLSYNVPFFYNNRSICLVWPASVPRGGIKKGVLLAFWYGYKLQDADNYLTKGTNKQIFYKIFYTADDIDEAPLVKILKAAGNFDQQHKKSKTIKAQRGH